MRLPSVRWLAESAGRTLARFPFVLLSAAVAAAGALAAIERWEAVSGERLIVTGVLGLPLFLSIRLLSERRRVDGVRRAVLQAAALGCLLAFALAWPRWSEAVQWRRFAQIGLGLHLLVAFLPFAGTRDRMDFWQYNRTLFQRFLTAALYTVVLYAGLSLALLAVDNLLGLEVSGESYLRLWVLIAFLFNTWFFLGGVPPMSPEARPNDGYPVGIKVFTQYVLVPLVAVYLTILTAYAVKIAWTRVWPGGWIGWLVSSVAVLGILSLLLLYPVRERTGNRWIRTYSRGFYMALAPSLVLLFLAIGKRIGQYGVTENRYFLLIGAIWLAGVALYYSISRSDDIRWIPQSLCAVALVTAFGPWSAYSVAERSQLDRLHGLLARNGMVAGREIRPAAGPVSFEDRREISAAVRYLLDTHGPESMHPVLGDLPEEVAPEEEEDGAPRLRVARARELVHALGIDYVDDRERMERFMFLVGTISEAVPIAGYDYALTLNNKTRPDTIRVGGAVLILESDSTEVRISRDGRPLAEVPFAPVIERMRASQAGHTRSPIPFEAGKAEIRSEALDLLIYFMSIDGEYGESGPVVRSWAANMYMRWRGGGIESARSGAGSDR